MENQPLFLRVRYERQKRRLSIKNAGRLAGLTTAEISLIENGRPAPSPGQLEKLGKAYHVSPAAVLLKPVSIRDESEVVVERTETTTA
ncbi:MAG TPA: helix-turn-helix transcriptional regulator [Vicinamibacterales bacterium]|nr:helix-turn-helix transcriptional regulator [Vicinamibacterales bacterium]